MATMQLQKTRMAQTKTKTTMTQKQSLEVVQTLLHGGLSSLAYLRSWFAEKAFKQQIYSAGSGGDRIPSYQAYVSGNLPKISGREDVMHTIMKVLCRKRSKRVDVFLDWLEKGVFVALKEGTLKALQVYVHTDPDDREKVVETYTFTIKYHPDGRGGRLYAGIEIDSPGKASATVEATNRSLQVLLRQIIEICNELPELPEKRFVSMALFHLENIKDFKAPGFEPSTARNLLFARTEGWEKQTRFLDDLESAFHSTSLKVSHLNQPALRAISSVAEPSRIPSILEYSSNGTREAEIPDMRDVLPDDISTVFPVGDTEVDPTTPAPTSALAIQQVEHETPPAGDPTPVQANFPAGPTLKASIDTQSSDVPNMKKALQGMMRPEYLSQGDTQTQAMQPAPVVEPSASAQLTLLPDIARQLRLNKVKLERTALNLAGVTRRNSKDSDILLCQCGYREEEGDMINCSFCGTWQHLHCYGFTGSADPRMPEDHACYQCLLSGHEEQLQSKMKDLAQKRRAMSFALQHVLILTNEELAKSMDISISTAKTILNYFVAEGFVTTPSGTHRNSFPVPNKPYFVPVQEGPTYDKLQQELFDPLRHINSFYANVPTTLSTTVARQLRSLRAMSMPPAATPASPSRKRAIATPVPALSAHPHLAKRPLDDVPQSDDIFSTPAKRQARATPIYRRFRSVQTTAILNADGLSSPSL